MAEGGADALVLETFTASQAGPALDRLGGRGVPVPVVVSLWQDPTPGEVRQFERAGAAAVDVFTLARGA